jgi:hypothetical protein
LTVPQTQTSHFWVGYFPEEKAAEYFVEVHGEDDEEDEDEEEEEEDSPVSAFARDQGVTWYDHDFLEYGFTKEAKPIEELAKGYSYSEQWAAELAHRAATAELTGINFFVFINKEEIAQPKSVQGDGYWLHYLGTIKYRI